jgi:hypothetical protein
MIHARKDYQARIVDLENKIGIDEPVFLMRAQDDAFPAILAYAISRYRGQQASGVVERLERHLLLAHEWRKTHATKVADVPPDA